MNKAHCAQRAQRQGIFALAIEYLIEIDFSITRASLVYKPTQLHSSRASDSFARTDSLLRRKTL